MRPSFRISIVVVFLFATLMQMFLPLYSVRAEPIAIATAVQCAGIGVVEPPISSGPTVPVTDLAVFQMLNRIKATTGGTCTNATKESFIQHVLNVLAYAAINIVLQTITKQIIGWIQGRDSGFVQNLQQEATRTADAEVGGLLVDLTGVNLCGNIGAFLKLSIGVPTASIRQRFQCSVTDIVQNVENFYQNFADGGWPAFFQISLEPQNNAYGAFLLAAGVEAQRKDGAQTNLLQGLIQGSGFEGFKVARDTNCRDVSPEQKDEMERFVQIQQQSGGKPTRVIRENTSFDAEVSTESGYTVCDVTYDTKTPGKLFADALPVAAFSGIRRAELANTIDQSIGQIVLALLQRIIKESTGGGRGLFGASDIGTPSPTTLAEAGFHTDYITNQTDDSSLRLEASQTLLDAKMQNIDSQIIAINTQIAPLETACAAPNPGDTCNQGQLTSLNAEKTRLTTERATTLTLLSRAHRNLIQILDIRTRILTTTNATTLENLATQLNEIQSDVNDLVQQAGGPAVGDRSSDIDDNLVRIITNTRDRATAIVAYLEKRIAAEIEPAKKAALTKARGDLKKLADDLDALREDFLDAISDDTPTAGIITQITGKIGDINDKILSVYSL